ncbi:hypothetical protein B0A50_02865 [Salinomyces thailandicus]|uniref:Uncharacterized protein n=1 Tax=Salinomyces thailandicus TaxID=706561 RepID=A0A4U0U6S0_9PEZI|nr:hypothetical protein B0A50_02865 [Salinomyces thailandica]
MALRAVAATRQRTKVSSPPLVISRNLKEYVRRQEGRYSHSGYLAFEALFAKMMGLSEDILLHIFERLTPIQLYYLEMGERAFTPCIKRYEQSIHKSMFERVPHLTSLYQFSRIQELELFKASPKTSSPLSRALCTLERTESEALCAVKLVCATFSLGKDGASLEFDIQDAVLVLMKQVREWPLGNTSRDMLEVSRLPERRRTNVICFLDAVFKAETTLRPEPLPADMPLRYLIEAEAAGAPFYRQSPVVLQRLKLLFVQAVRLVTNRLPIPTQSLRYCRPLGKSDWGFSTTTGHVAVTASSLVFTVLFTESRSRGRIIVFDNSDSSSQTSPALMLLKLLFSLQYGEQWNHTVFQKETWLPWLRRHGLSIGQRRARWNWATWRDSDLGLKALFELPEDANKACSM